MGKKLSVEELTKKLCEEVLKEGRRIEFLKLSDIASILDVGQFTASKVLSYVMRKGLTNEKCEELLKHG